MGSSESQSQEELQIGNERNSDLTDEIVARTDAANVHIKYEEFSYNEFKILEKPIASISPVEIFNIAVCHPEFCQSVTDMIRHAIRTKSIQEKKKLKNYKNDFSCSDNMEYNIFKVRDRFESQYQLQHFFNESHSKSKKINSAAKDVNERGIGFHGILTYLRDCWYKNNKNAIDMLRFSIQSLLGPKNSNPNYERKLREIICNIIGSNDFDALAPKRSFNFDEIQTEMDILEQRILGPINTCSMIFPSTTKFIKKITIQGEILRHGICSNGTFLFILTKEKTLFVYRLYKGIIDKLVNQIELKQSWKFNEETFLFCSQKTLFLKNENTTFQSSILSIINSNCLSFNKSDKNEFEQLISACSNGVSFSIINSKNIHIFNAETETLCKSYTISKIPSNLILLPNGYFLGLLENSGKIQIFPLNQEKVKFEPEDHFPIENEGNIEAATIDMISNCYFSVSYFESKSIVYCYPYIGVTDLTLFGSDFLPIQSNEKNISHSILNHVSACAFSSLIPENFITPSENYDDDLKSIKVMIEKFNDKETILCKALFLLLEINMRKFHCKDFLPFLLNFLKSEKYKKIISAILFYNIDLFFDKFDEFSLSLIKSVLNSSSDNDGQMFNEWLITCLLRSNLLTKIDLNENLLKFWFGENWIYQSRTNKEFSWIVDLLLISQQSIAYNAMKYIEKDPLNLGKSQLIDSLCNQANFLFQNFHNYLSTIINNHQDISCREIDYQTILYTLISNFVVVVSPITQCSQFAIAITNDIAKAIITLLSDEFINDKKPQLFVEYFYMIYTLAISGLIRGGPVYQCEIDFSWLIKGNFYNGSRKLIASDLNDTMNFLTSYHLNEILRYFIEKENENIEFIYQKNRNYKPSRDDYKIIDRIILAAVLYQTGTFDRLYEVKERNELSSEIKSIMNFTRKIRSNYSKALQKDINNNNNNDQKEIKEANKYIANMGILFILDPVLTDFQKISAGERNKYFNLLEKFILNNDPYQFCQVLQAVPNRIDNIFKSFDNLNTLLFDTQIPRFKAILIDGISRVDSFERLGYLLSDEKLNNDFSILEVFCMICTGDTITKDQQLSILEILYTVLVTCEKLKEKAINSMNALSKFISKDTFVLDSYFMTVAGLAKSTCTPCNFSQIPEIGKAYILQLIYAKRDITTQPIIEIMNLINAGIDEECILNDVWVRMIFTLLANCQFDDSDQVFECLDNIFKLTSNFIDDRCLVFPTFPSIIYGFRHLINMKNNSDPNDTISVSNIAYNLIFTITTKSKISEIFLLFSIIGANFSDFSDFYEIRNHRGSWLKCPDNRCLSLPLCPFSESHDFNMDEIFESIQEEELNLKNSLDLSWVIEYWDICMKDHGSLLCRVYLQSLIRYVSELNVDFLKDRFDFLSDTMRPYVDFYKLISKQTLTYKSIRNSFKDIELILPETKHRFGQIKQFDKTHLLIYNVMKLGDFVIFSIFKEKGYFVIHNHDIIVIDLSNNLIIINDMPERFNIDKGQLHISIHSNNLEIIVNKNYNFPCDENCYIEFITEKIEFVTEKIVNFTDPKICYIDNVNNMKINYIDDIFIPKNVSMNDFVDDLNNLIPVNSTNANASIYLREGYNIFYNQIADEIIFKRKNDFVSSPSILCHFSRIDEMNICNQLKSVILANCIIKNLESLDWDTTFSLAKSAVITLSSFDAEKLSKGQFPFSLDDGFFNNFSLNFLQSKNVQTFFIAMKTLLKSKWFLDNLGNQLVKMARDHVYHNLIHKKDLVIFNGDQFQRYERKKNDYIVNFSDGTIGKLEIDEFGNWMVNTPMILLLLLWIFIDNCSTPQQRIDAKLTLIDCWIIKSPMINRYLPEFLSFMQRKLLFSPEDFDPVYIYHLSSLAKQESTNEQIKNFYEFERNCHKLKQIQQQISSKSIDFNTLQKVDFDSLKKEMNPRKMIEIIQLMKSYDSVDNFPVWYFLPIWRTISCFSFKNISSFDLSFQYKRASTLSNTSNEPLLYSLIIEDSNNNFDFELFDNHELKNGEKLTFENQSKKFIAYFVIQPNQAKFLVMNDKSERKAKIQEYQIFKEEEQQLTYENFESDIKKFAIDWTDKETEELLNFHCSNFWCLMFEINKLSSLIDSFGLRIVQCKAACLSLINSLNSNEDEMFRLAKENSKFLSYQFRMNKFKFQPSPTKQNIFQIGLGRFNNSRKKYISLNSDLALEFISGESENVNYSMIYQISKYIISDTIKRFQNPVWAVEFKDKESSDLSGVTNQTISMSVQSFLSPRTGICIISPNFTEIGSNESDIQVIPYPTKCNKNVMDVLFSFGVILGSIIRTGMSQEIPFPLFVWNYLSGKTITKSDIYENDTRLKDTIMRLKSGELNDHLWVYRDWNNVVKPINGCPIDKFVPCDLAEVYETLVINLRIESIEKFLKEIRKGFLSNVDIQIPQFLSGGLVLFLCNGKKNLDHNDVTKRLFFKNGNQQLKKNLVSIIEGYDEKMLKNFLMFVIASKKLPNLVISPDFCISVEFEEESDKLPTASTCFKLIRIPAYQQIDVMKSKLDYAIQNCTELELS